MTQNTRGSIKAHFRNLQKLYNFYITAALAACVILLGLLAISLFSIVQINTGIGIIITLLILVLFLPFSILIKVNNQNHHLKIPAFTSRKTLKIFQGIAIVSFIIVFTYGILFYPRMPIEPNANIFTDKAGNVFSLSQFLAFQKWEFTFLIFWCIFALTGMILFPFVDSRARKWWNF